MNGPCGLFVCVCVISFFFNQFFVKFTCVAICIFVVCMVCVCWFVVGVLCENCIVDASIKHVWQAALLCGVLCVFV